MRHPIDMSVVGVLKWGPDSLRFFTEGWGDEQDLHPPKVDEAPAAPVDVRWLTSANEGNVVVSHGVFQSPLAGLPHRATQGHVLGIRPAGHEPRRLVVGDLALDPRGRACHVHGGEHQWRGRIRLLVVRARG